jgi:rare lipoprotein A
MLRLLSIVALTIFVSTEHATPQAMPAYDDAPMVEPAIVHPIVASWYGPRFQHRRTASGARFDMRKLTAAHRELPFGTKVRVTALDSGKSVVVTITDRGPYAVPARRSGIVADIDLSKAAATRIGVSGLAQVKLEIVSRG